VKALRQGKVGPQGKITDPMRWMERKTAVRQLVKMMPKSPTLTHALEVDEQGGHELHRQLIAENTPAAIPSTRVKRAKPQHLPRPPANPEPEPEPVPEGQTTLDDAEPADDWPTVKGPEQ
jgi:hypothetical protein